MFKILFLGSHLQSFYCLRYLLTLKKFIKLIGIVPHSVQPPIKKMQDVRNIAKKNGIPIFKFEDIENLNYDLGISLLYDRILGEKAINQPKLGFINLHLGTLPRFRGANGVMHALLLARKDNRWDFGVTMHYIDIGIDTGPVIDKIEVPIFESDTAYILHSRASKEIYNLFKRNIKPIIFSPTKLPIKKITTSEKSYFFKRNEIDFEVDFKRHPDEIYDHVRALSFPKKKKPFVRIGKYKFYLSIEDVD